MGRNIGIDIGIVCFNQLHQGQFPFANWVYHVRSWIVPIVICESPLHKQRKVSHNHSCTVAVDLLKHDFRMKGTTQESNSSNDFVSIRKFLKKYSWSISYESLASIVKRLFSSVSLNNFCIQNLFPFFFRSWWCFLRKIHKNKSWYGRSKTLTNLFFEIILSSIIQINLNLQYCCSNAIMLL